MGEFLNCILQLGVGPDAAQHRLDKKLRLANQVSLTCATACIPWAGMTWMMGLNVSALMLLGASAACFLSLFLIAQGRHVVGRLLIGTSLSVLVTFNSVAWGVDGGAQMFLYVIASTPVMIFMLDEVLCMVWSTMLPVVGFYFATTYLQSHPPIYEVLPAYLDVLYYSSSGTTFAVLILTVLHYYRVNMTAEAQLKKLLAETLSQQQTLLASSKMAALGEMAGGMAHEINNPLATLCMILDQLVEMQDSGEKVEGAFLSRQLGRARETTRRITRIVSGLLAFSRDGSRDPMRPCSLRKIVDDTVGLCGEKFQAYGVRLEVDPIPEEVNVMAREVQISQVLVNLLNNAFDAVCAGPEERSIRIELERHRDALALAVSNSGPPIPQNLADKIFQPFFTTKAVGKGTGLGLSISKGLVESHGGSLTLDRSSPRTRFVVELKAP